MLRSGSLNQISVVCPCLRHVSLSYWLSAKPDLIACDQYHYNLFFKTLFKGKNFAVRRVREG